MQQMDQVAKAQTDNEHYVVVYDPSNEFWQGAIVEGAVARQLEASNVVILPISSKLLANGVGGFHSRSWGAGFPLDTSVPRMVCPLTMYCTKDYPVLHWVARLVVDADLLEKISTNFFKSKNHIEGMLRFASDTGQSGTQYASYSPIDRAAVLLSELGAPDEDGGWTVKGCGKIGIPVEGHYGFAFYGMAPGVRVAWAACSISVD